MEDKNFLDIKLTLFPSEYGCNNCRWNKEQQVYNSCLGMEHTKNQRQPQDQQTSTSNADPRKKPEYSTDNNYNRYGF